MVLRHRVVYRANDGYGLLKVIETAWRNWVISKPRENANPDLLQSNGDFFQISDVRRAKWEQIENGQIAAVRLTDIVNTGDGEYSIVITWVLHPSGAWVQIDGFAPDAESRYQPPKISHELFSAAYKADLALFDESPEIRYTPAPQVIGRDKVDDFISRVLVQPERSTLALVAGTDFNADQRLWRDALEQSIYPKVVGMTTMWLLTAEATEYFNSKVSEIYQVLPSSIHAFRPELNFNHLGDGVRHRYFTKLTISQALTDRGSERYLQNRLYYLARSTSLGVKLPKPLLDADELFDDREVELQADRILKFSPRDSQSHGYKLREALQERRRNAASEAPEGDSTQNTRPEPVRTEVSVLKSKDSPKLNGTTDKNTNSGSEATKVLHLETFAPHESTSDSEKSEKADGLENEPAQSDTEIQQSLFVEETLQMLLESTDLTRYGVDSTEDGLIALVDFAEKGSDAEIRISEFRDSYVQQGQRLRQLEKELANFQHELEESERWRTELADHNRSLYKSLMSAEAPPEAYAIPTARPDSTAELLERIEDEFPHIVFTGERGSAENLDERTTSDVIARRTWEALQILEDYANEFEKHGSVERFLRSEHTIQQFKVSHAPSESDSVAQNARFRRARELPVPEAVDPTGKIYMEAHFKITNDGGKAPRMHYYDAMKECQQIFIGYLGEHLPNTMTS